MGGNDRSGRKPDWFRERCAEILGDYELVEFVGRVAAGKETEQRIVSNKLGHEIIDIACDTQDRLAAFKMLAEWGVGKPVQYVANQSSTPSDSVRQAQQIFEMVKQLEAGELVNTKSHMTSNGMSSNGNGIK